MTLMKPGSIVIVATAMLVIGSLDGRAQLAAPPISSPIYKNIFSLGGSVGFPYKQDDTWFWGVSTSYTRLIKIPWSASIGFSYDRGISKPSGEPKSVTNGFTMFSTINYTFLKVITASTGFGKVIISDNNNNSSLNFTNGDWIAGLALGVSLPDIPWTVRDSVGVGVSWLWDFNEEEPSVSLDLSFGWSF